MNFYYYSGLQCACLELERMYPKLYTNVTRQTGFLHGNGVSGILLAVGHYLLRSEPTWGKVVAVFTVAGGLAVDCVRHAHHEQLPSILEDMTELLEDKMAEWVNFNGGWVRDSKCLRLSNSMILCLLCRRKTNV